MSTVIAVKRDPRAKAKQLRRMGIVPCSVYGASLPASLSVQLDQNTVSKLLRGKDVGSRVELTLNDKVVPVIIKEIARDTLKNEVQHIGFQVLKADVKVNGTAHIVLANQEKIGGFVSQVLFEIPYTAYPADLVDTITIDLTELAVGSSLMVRDLEIANNPRLELLIDADTLVLSIADVKRAPADGEAREQ